MFTVRVEMAVWRVGPGEPSPDGTDAKRACAFEWPGPRHAEVVIFYHPSCLLELHGAYLLQTLGT